MVISSIIIHFILTIFYFISYKGEFFIGLSLSFVTVVGIFFLVFVTNFSEFSILLLVLGGLTYLITMIVNHTRGLHGISIGMLYGAQYHFLAQFLLLHFYYLEDYNTEGKYMEEAWKKAGIIFGVGTVVFSISLLLSIQFYFMEDEYSGYYYVDEYESETWANACSGYDGDPVTNWSKKNIL